VSAPGAADEEVQALLVEIFARTGQKVEAGDPVVAAALIHSALLRRAGQDAARAIEQAALRARQDAERRAREPLAAGELVRARSWPGAWRAWLMPGAALLLLGMLAGALGTYMVIVN